MYLHLIFFLSLFSQIYSKEKLVFVLTHFRHGARAPQKYINNEKHLDYILQQWDRPGELTPMGQRMHYALGLRNRERYIDNYHFLSKKFDPHEILVYSTRFNRTLLSVASQLQGLYPFGLGGELTKDQIPKSEPPINLSSDVKNELEKLENNSLPGKMSLVPIRMINDNERKVIIYDIDKCLWKRDEMREINYKNSEELKSFIENFGKNYSTELDKMYGENKTYDIHFVDNFCDAFIAGSTEQSPMVNISNTEIDKEELLKDCFKFMNLNFRVWIGGDEERILPTLEISKLMREFIHYMKARIDADINKEKIEEKLEDYSRPKMMMLSAHDSTTSMWELFLIKVFFNNNDTYYIFPTFSTQIAFEVYTDEDTTRSKTYKDYYILYYFNDDLILNKTVEEFINAVEPKLYSDEKINEICKFDQEEKKDDDSDKDLYFNLMIVFSATTGLFLIMAIFFIIKASRSKSSETINKEGQLLNSYE